MNVHGVHDVRQTETHTAEPLLPEPSAFEVDLAIEKLKSHKLPGIDQIPAEKFKGIGRKFSHQFHKLIDSALQNNRNSWVEFDRYVKRRKWNRVNIPMIKGSNGEPALIR